MRKSIQALLTDPVMGKERHADIPCLLARFTVCFSPTFLSSRFFIHLCQYIISCPFFLSFPRILRAIGNHRQPEEKAARSFG